MKTIKEELTTCLQAGPGAAARQAKGFTPKAPAPSRWQLRTIRASVDWLQDYSLSGVWYLLARCDLKLRSARVQHHSPDPDSYEETFSPEKMLARSGAEPETGRGPVSG